MILAILFILLISFGIGLPLALLLVPKHNIWGKLGLSYLLGVGIFTLIIYITNILGLKITALNIALLFLAFAVFLVIFQHKKIINFKNEILDTIRFGKLDFADKLLIGAIALFVISSFINTLYWPVFKWDSLTLYDFRAHIFVETGFIKEALTNLKSSFYFGYPLLTSLLHTIVYIFGGNNPKFVYSLYYLVLGLIFYGQLREFVSRKLSLLFTLMLLTVPQIFNQSLVSYTNLTYLTYFSLGAIYYFIWDKKKEIGYLILTVIIVGFSTWVRSTEPFWLGLFGIMIFHSIFRKNIWVIVTTTFLFVPIQQIWSNVQARGLQQGTTLQFVIGYTKILNNLFNIERWNAVIKFIYPSVVAEWGPILLLFLIALLYTIFKHKIKPLLLILFISVSFVVMIFLGTFIFSFTYKGWAAIPDSASRAALIVYPLFVFSSAIIISNRYTQLYEK